MQLWNLQSSPCHVVIHLIVCEAKKKSKKIGKLSHDDNFVSTIITCYSRKVETDRKIHPFYHSPLLRSTVTAASSAAI